MVCERQWCVCALGARAPVVCLCLRRFPLLCETASGDRLLMRWFEEERRGFAFGCVFATGEFGGLMAFIVGWLLSRHDTGGYKTVYFIGGSSVRRPPPASHRPQDLQTAGCGDTAFLRAVRHL